MRRASHSISALALVVLVLTTLVGCSSIPSEFASTTPRWTCPTPTPLPTIQVEDGDETKIVNGTPVTVPTYRDTEPYEREYGLPVVRPTVWAKDGTSFYLGQIVNLGGGADLVVTVSPTDSMLGENRVYEVLVDLTTPFTISVDLERQVAINSVKDAGTGRMVGGAWVWSHDAAVARGLLDEQSGTTRTLAPPKQTLRVPVAAPDGEVEQVEVRFDMSLPNGGVQQEAFRVQFTNNEDKRCPAPGTYGAVYEGAPLVSQEFIAPPGSNTIVQTALRQLGQRYCWGAKGTIQCSGVDAVSHKVVTPACVTGGPRTTSGGDGATVTLCFDCSGLMWWSYKENGIIIKHGTKNQIAYPGVSPVEAQPGDLVLFAGHVGMLAGDVNGDGKMDMVHSANYPDGVVIASDIFHHPYWGKRIVKITRPPR